MTKLEAFTQYMSQFAAYRDEDMQFIMEKSSHGRIFSYAWEEATKADRERIKALEDELKDVIGKAIIARGNT
jgi:hypothetical protein